MLQNDIHCLITDIIVSLCKGISPERKRKWPHEVGPICDWQEWVAKGRPNPTGTISSSLLPQYNPLGILRVINEFFQNPSMQDRLRVSITKRQREITVDYDPSEHAIDLHTMTSMELFNGVGSVLNGGVRNALGPATEYIDSWAEDSVVTDWNSLEYFRSNYYKAWDCENDFVHPKNQVIGYYSQEYLDRLSSLRPTLANYARLTQDPHHSTMYSDIEFTNDNHPYLWDRDDTIRCFTKDEKRKIVKNFITQLCEKYIVNEPGASSFNRVTWYEVSEFIKFYYDSWQAIDHPDGDEDFCWLAEGITTVPLSCFRYNSSMYSVPGVWNMEEGGKWSDNFETIMKLGTNHINDWFNSIWNRKFDTYCQRVFEEDNIEIYRTIGVLESDEESGEESDEEYEQTQEIANETPKEKVRNLMEIIFENKSDMKEGVYLKLCNELKEIHDIL